MKNPTTLNARLKAAMAAESDDAKREINRFDEIVSTLRSLRDELKRLRKAQALTLADIGDKLGISVSAVSRLESRDGDFGILSLLQYADCLNYDVKIQFESRDTVQFSSERAETNVGRDVEAAPDRFIFGNSDIETCIHNFSEPNDIVSFLSSRERMQSGMDSVHFVARKGHFVTFGEIKNSDFGSDESDVLLVDVELSDAWCGHAPDLGAKKVEKTSVRINIGAESSEQVDAAIVSIRES